MKQLLKDFKNYFTAANRPAIRQTSVFRVLTLYALLIAFVIIESMSFTSSPIDDDSVTVMLAPTVLPILIVHFQMHAIKYKPTLAGLAPVNYKRRVIYDIFYPIILAIVCFICLAAFFMIIAGIVYLVSPESFVVEEDEIVGSGVGVIAVFFRFLFAYGCNIIIACRKKTKPKTILIAAFIAVYWAATLLTGYAINGFDLQLGANAMYITQFNNMALPWLGYTLWAIAGIGAMSAAVWYLIKFEKPKQF